MGLSLRDIDRRSGPVPVPARSVAPCGGSELYCDPIAQRTPRQPDEDTGREAASRPQMQASVRIIWHHTGFVAGW